MVYIYILLLEKGKYYIGKTNNPQFRLESHFNSNGSEWTKIYKPIKVLELKSDCDDYDEDKYTRIYMDKYGIDNVRGGSFVSVKLEKSVIDTLKKMNIGTNNKCFSCGKSGHFAKNCQENQFESDEEYEEIWVCEYCEQEFEEEKKCEIHMKYCNSKKIIINKNNNNIIVSDDSEDEDDIDIFFDNIEDIDNINYNCCFRCGRNGHYSSSCYASKHIRGYYLK